MARTARHLYRNLILDSTATLSASSEATGYGVVNLRSASRFRKWRSSAAAVDQWVKINFGAAKTFRAILLADVLAHVGGTVRVQANATDVWTSPTVNDLVTLPATNETGVVGVWRASDATLQWARVSFVNTGVVAQAVELAVWGMGTYFEPPYSLEPRYRYELVDPSIISQVPGGQRSATKVEPYFVVDGSYPPTLNTHRVTFLDVIRTVGKHTPHFFAINPDDMSFMTFYGRFNRVPVGTHVTSERTRWGFEFQEDV